MKILGKHITGIYINVLVQLFLSKFDLILFLQVFLQHLTPLLSLSTFTALWLTILEFMDKYMHADKSDLLVSSE
jgi:hypothetical protein